MQLKQQALNSHPHNLINPNFLPDYENSTSTKTFQDFTPNLKSPVSSKTISPLTQIIDIKNIKNDEFLFRMKLKFIASMQQLEIPKEDIQSLRKQETDSDVLTSFINPIKKEFAALKKLKDEYLLKETKNISSVKSIKNLESLEIISLESQLQEISESEKKLKHRCQRLFTQNAELVEKFKKKQHEFQESQNNLYQTRLLLKEYESVIENLKVSAKKVEKDFLGEKDRLNEELNATKELMVRQREAKQIYLSKLDNLETSILEKDDLIKKLTDDGEFLKKQCIKWKNRSEWRENETNQEVKLGEQRLKELQQEAKKLTDSIKTKDMEILLAKKEASSSTDVFNKKLEKIVEEWKTKLIDTIEEYEGTIENYSNHLAQLQKDVQRMKKLEKQVQILSVQKGQGSQELASLKLRLTQKDKRNADLQRQLQETTTFYTQKIKELESIITQLKSESLSKTISIDQSKHSLASLSNEVKQKQVQIERLKTQLTDRQNELKKISEAKKDTQNELLKRISLTENNRIIEISKIKVQYEERLSTTQKQLKKAKDELSTFQVELMKICPKQQTPFGKDSTESLSEQISNKQSSNPSVNNSFNTGLQNGRANDRSNRLISETYGQPQKSSSIRRVFVSSNSINDYVKDRKTNQGSQEKKQAEKSSVSKESFTFSVNRPSIKLMGQTSEKNQ